MFDEAMDAWGSAHDWTWEELFQIHLRFKATYDYFWSRGRIVHPLPYCETMSRKAMSGVLLRILMELKAVRSSELPIGPCIGNSLSGRCLKIVAVFSDHMARPFIVARCMSCHTYVQRSMSLDWWSRHSAAYDDWAVMTPEDFAVLQVMRS